MGPLSLGLSELELGNESITATSASTDRLLWQNVPGSYIDIDASGDNLLIS